ncbi:hypothetical protein B9Z55_011142 [Caenorhabditis nigoni]|uniref:Disease resistance R13L4/SHOC-2-like LRR domain-containing protein n=1 Tax=Caenorhabditis nigoni TaxID=1611254 RepID=A0A2G5UIV1_9PELO|nr:hypothetical protein B9Z55_011142 [Caenorhabditis nigoni]
MSAPKYSLTELRNLQEDDELDLSACGIKDFPNAIVQLTRLTKLDISSNSIAYLPESFCKMTKLIRLDFGNNQLDHLPDGIGYLTSLQHLNLYNNKLEDLPLSFANLKSLKWLDLKKNPLNAKLLAIAGNCGTDAECKTAAKQVVNVYMGDRQKQIDNQKAQEAKHKAKVQKAQEEEKIRKHQEKKKKDLEKKNEGGCEKNVMRKPFFVCIWNRFCLQNVILSSSDGDASESSSYVLNVYAPSNSKQNVKIFRKFSYFLPLLLDFPDVFIGFLIKNSKNQLKNYENCRKIEKNRPENNYFRR